MHQILSTVAALAFFASTGLAQSRLEPDLIAAARKSLPTDLSTNVVTKALEVGLWNSNLTAIAISINRVPKASVIFVFLKQSDGSYLASNVSGVEGGNFGVLGISGRGGYDRFETTPLEWLHRDDGRFQVVMQTRAWKAGKRYTVSENLLIAKNGTPLYR
ncbi:MAG: hypothetical protein U1F83_00815 [Verrucomicrobiota bacterium]